MSLEKKIKVGARRRAMRVRSRLSTLLPRVSVFRSLKHMCAQIIDDRMQKTLLSCSSLELKDVSGDKKAVAFEVGRELARRAVAQGLSAVVFDRGSFLYHGRVESLAKGLREGGLNV